MCNNTSSDLDFLFHFVNLCLNKGRDTPVICVKKKQSWILLLQPVSALPRRSSRLPGIPAALRSVCCSGGFALNYTGKMRPKMRSFTCTPPTPALSLTSTSTCSRSSLNVYRRIPLSESTPEHPPFSYSPGLVSALYPDVNRVVRAGWGAAPPLFLPSLFTTCP